MTETPRWPQSPPGGLEPTDPSVAHASATPASRPVQQDAELTRIYREEVAFVWNRLRRLGVAERDIEDKVHDVFVIVHQKLQSYDRSRPLRPWLAGISVRVAIAHHRGAHQRRVVLEEVDPADWHCGPDLLLETRRDHELVLAALDELPLEQRAVLVLKELDGFSMPEIEEMLEAPLNTLYSRLRLGKQRFSAAVRRLRRQEGAP